MPSTIKKFSSKKLHLKESEEAVAPGQYLNIPDQAYNYSDPELPAFFINLYAKLSFSLVLR